jgi:hypothetical protein
VGRSHMQIRCVCNAGKRSLYRRGLDTTDIVRSDVKCSALVLSALLPRRSPKPQCPEGAQRGERGLALKRPIPPTIREHFETIVNNEINH